MKIAFSVLLLAGLCSACSLVSLPTLTPGVAATATLDTHVLAPLSATPSPAAPTATPFLASKTPIPATLTPQALPSATPSPACVTLAYEEYAQVELIAPNGSRVLVDVADPSRLSSPATAADILLTTHTHWDHINADFQAAFPGQQLMAQEGSLELPGANIKGMASAHNASDPFRAQGGTNYIYLIEMAGMRIAHFGDIGQNVLTQEQLDILVPLDVAIIQLDNPYSDMDAQNRKALTLLEPLAPRLVIPTHVNLDMATLAVARWPGLYSENSRTQLCRATLGEQTQVLFMGQAATTFLNYLDLQLVSWPSE